MRPEGTVQGRAESWGEWTGPYICSYVLPIACGCSVFSFVVCKETRRATRSFAD